MKYPRLAKVSHLLAAALALVPGARAGTITVEGDQLVTGNQTVGSNQVVAGALTVSNQAGSAGLVAQGPAAQIADTRLRSLGPAESDRWIRVVRIGDGGATNALFSGRLLAEGKGVDYVADFAFPAAPQSGAYKPLLVEMGAATNFAWGVWVDGGETSLWFLQPAGSRFANFLYGQHGCTDDWGSPGSPSGSNLWSSASGERGGIRAGGVTLTGAGLWLPDGTLLDARSNMTASAIVDGTNTLLAASGGRLAFGAPADFSGQVNLPGTVALGTNGVTLSAERWGMVDSSFTNGATWGQGLAANLGATIRGMAADTNGNRYVYGGFAGTMAVGATSIQSGTASADADLAGFVVKFGADGAPAWSRSFPVTNHAANGTPGQWLVELASAKTDAAGNLYLGGSLRAPAIIGGSVRTPSGGGDGFVLSLAPDGGFRWFRQLGGSHANADSIVDIDVDPAGTNIVAGGTVWGMAEYNYNAESYYFDDSNGYAAKLDGSGTVVSEWSLGGHPDDGGTWQFGHEYSSEGEYHWNTRVEHVCASGGGAVVAWTYPDENGRSVRKVGGSSQWHLGTGSYGSGWPVRDLLRAGGDGVLLIRDVNWDIYDASAAILVTSGGSVAWSRSGSWEMHPVEYWEVESKQLREAVVAPDGAALLAWWETWWVYEDPDYIQYYRKTVEKIGTGGAVDWTVELPASADVARLLVDPAGMLHAYGTYSGTMDLGAAGSLDGSGSFHLRFSGTSSNVLALAGAPGAVGSLVAFDAAGPVIGLACSGPPPSYIHSDPSAVSVSVGGILDASGGLRLGDGTVVASAGDIVGIGPWRSGSTAGSYWYSGNLGVGTVAPGVRLDVSGDARASGTLTSGGGRLNLGTNGVALTEARWDALDDSLQVGGDARALSASGYSSIRGMVADASGNRYVYGAFAGTMNLGGGTVLSSATTQNDRAGFVLKLDPLGYLLWAQAFPLVNHSANGQQNEMLVEIASGRVDGSGNLVLGGTFRARAMFAGTDQTPQGAGDAFAVCLKPDGTRLWFQKWSGGGTAADGVSDLAVAAGGTNLWVGGTWAKSGGSDTDGMVRRIKASDGNTITNWTLAGNPGDTNAADVASSVTRVCAASNDVAVAWEAGSARSVRRLGATSWWQGRSNGAIGGLWGDAQGNVVVREAGGDNRGRVSVLGPATGGELWSQAGSYTSWDDPEYGYYGGWESTNLLDVLTLGDGGLFVAWRIEHYDWWYDEYEYATYENSWANTPVRRLSISNGGQLWQSGTMDSVGSCRLGMDLAGNLHAVGGNRHVRFQGTGATVAEASTFTPGAGSLVDFVSTPEAFTLAYQGPPPTIMQDSDWEVTLAVDGYVSVGEGIRLGDGTYLSSATDIASLVPVRFGAGGSAYYSDGNLGIGTNAPGARLDVVGDARISGPVTLQSGIAVGGLIAAQGGLLVTNGDLVVHGNLTVTGTNLLAWVPPGGDVSMGAFTNGPAQ